LDENQGGQACTIVVGSGIGGLAVAALLAKVAGQRVLVLGRHYTAGGLTHSFHRPGFDWDVGVHYVGQVHEPGSQAHALFEYLTEGRLDWQPMPDVYDRVVIGDHRFDYVRGETRLRDRLQAAFPAEARAVERYFAAIHQCLRRMPFFYAEKMLPPTPSRLLGRALRAPFLSVASRTTADVLDDFEASPELRAVLTAQWGDYGLPPKYSRFGIHALVTSHYVDGAAYPVGGAGQMAASLLPTIEAAGGTVVVGAEQGQIYGLAHSPERFKARDLRPWTPIGNLFLTGQDVSTCGVMGALTGAVTAASAMLGRNLFRIGAGGAVKVRDAA
jgi:all-trans-retinol 13,14-reductase